MTALLRSELLKARTTRARFAYLIVIALLTGLAVAGMVGSAFDPERGTVEFQADLLDPATIALLLALLFGITIVTNEFRHGTITPTFLASPVRERVLAAKGIVAAGVGALFALFGIGIAAAVAVPWLTALDHDVHAGDSAVWRQALEIVLAATLWGVFGAAVGSLVHSQIGGVVGALVWLFVAENILAALLGLTRWDEVGDYFPGRVIDSVSGNDDATLGVGTALAVALAYVGVIGTLGVLRTRRRDIT